MVKNFLPRLSKEQLKSVYRFLNKCVNSKYADDPPRQQYIMSQLDLFFEIRIQRFTSTMDALLVMKTIARYFCFITDLTDFGLCTWDVLVRRLFFVIPSIRIVNRNQLLFKYKKKVFKVHPSYYVYGYRHEDRFLTFNITITE